MTTNEVKRLNDLCPGPMSRSELDFLDKIKQFIEKTIREGVSFDQVFKDLLVILRALCNSSFNSRDPLANKMMELPIGSLEKAPLSASQLKFLNDFCRIIDYAVRNGLGFSFPIHVMAHDVGEIQAYHDGDLDKALSTGFKPKGSGWTEITEDSFGEDRE